MFGVVLMKRGKDGKDRLVNEDDVAGWTIDEVIALLNDGKVDE